MLETVFCGCKTSKIEYNHNQSKSGVIRMKKICNIVVVLSLLPIITPMKINKIWENGYFNLKKGYHERNTDNG